MLNVTLTRTANAGVLLELDGKSILLDGVCQTLPPYQGTPTEIKNFLLENTPDVVAFTHEHLDHYDASYVKLYKEKTLRSVYGPESLNFYEVGNGVKMFLVPTRHIGKTDVEHVSYVIKGSSTIYFMGDATPLALKKMQEYATPDVLIVPFAFTITKSAWRATKEMGAKRVILLHMPSKEDDREGLYNMLNDTVGEDSLLTILNIGEKITL